MFKNKISWVALFSIFFISACGVEDETPKSYDVKYKTVSVLGSTVNDQDASDEGPEISATGLELYFNSDRAGSVGGMDLYVSTRASTDVAWEAATNLGTMINTTANEQAASLSEDGLTLVFATDRVGANMNLYKSTRTTIGGAWSTPENLGEVNTASIDAGPDLTAKGLVLFFHSNRTDAKNPSGNNDLYGAERADTGSTWGVPVNLGTNVNSAAHDMAPEMASDGLSLFFHSSRTTGGSATYNIWRATRARSDGDWGVPVLVPAPVDLESDTFTPALSHDWQTLYFASDVGVSRDIYQAVP